MKRKIFKELTKSLEQAVAYKGGDKTAARVVTREESASPLRTLCYETGSKTTIPPMVDKDMYDNKICIWNDRTGDCMARGVVYSRSRASAERKLTEIADQDDGCLYKTLEDLWVITDKTYWNWVNPMRESARGIRSDKAWVDNGCTIRDYHYVVLPGFRGNFNSKDGYDDIRFFE